MLSGSPRCSSKRFSPSSVNAIPLPGDVISRLFRRVERYAVVGSASPQERSSGRHEALDLPESSPSAGKCAEKRETIVIDPVGCTREAPRHRSLPLLYPAFTPYVRAGTSSILSPGRRSPVYCDASRRTRLSTWEKVAPADHAPLVRLARRAPIRDWLFRRHSAADMQCDGVRHSIGPLGAVDADRLDQP